MSDFNKKITITANTKEAEGALARLELQMKGFGESIEHFSGRFEGVSRASENLVGKLEKLGLASLFAEGGAIGLANKIADMGFELGEAAIKTGLTTAQLQYWQYVAKQAGIDSDTLTMAFARLNANVGRASKPTSEQAQALRFLGVSAKDANGHVKSSNDLFVQVMGALGKVHDQTKRNLAAQILLSRSYIELLPVMKAISSGSKENTEDFKKYVQTLDDGAIKKSDEFHRASINLQAALGSLAAQVGMQLMPVILPLVKSMSDYVAINRKLIATNISNFITTVSGAFKDAWTAAAPFLKIVGEIIDKMGGLKTVILAVGGYIAADLVVSFVTLGIQIGLATFALGSFLLTGSVSAFMGIVGLVKKLTSAFEILQATMLLNPVTVALAGISSAFLLIIFAATKLVAVLKQIKDTFNGHELMRELGVVGGAVAGLFGSGRNATQSNTGSPASGGFLSALSPVAARPIMPILQRNNPVQNRQSNLNVHLKIDSEGKPTIANVQSSDPLTFTSSLGLLR